MVGDLVGATFSNFNPEITGGGGGDGNLVLGGVGVNSPSDDFGGGVCNFMVGDSTGEVTPFTAIFFGGDATIVEVTPPIANSFGGDATFAFLIALGPNTSVLTPIGLGW